MANLSDTYRTLEAIVKDQLGTRRASYLEAQAALQVFADHAEDVKPFAARGNAVSKLRQSLAGIFEIEGDFHQCKGLVGNDLFALKEAFNL